MLMSTQFHQFVVILKAVSNSTPEIEDALPCCLMAPLVGTLEIILVTGLH